MGRRSRKIADELIKAVKRGQAYTVYDKNDDPVALMLPWDDWAALNSKLRYLESVMTHRDAEEQLG